MCIAAGHEDCRLDGRGDYAASAGLSGLGRGLGTEIGRGFLVEAVEAEPLEDMRNDSLCRVRNESGRMVDGMLLKLREGHEQRVRGEQKRLFKV